MLWSQFKIKRWFSAKRGYSENARNCCVISYPLSNMETRARSSKKVLQLLEPGHPAHLHQGPLLKRDNRVPILFEPRRRGTLAIFFAVFEAVAPQDDLALGFREHFQQTLKVLVAALETCKMFWGVFWGVLQVIGQRLLLVIAILPIRLVDAHGVHPLL